MSWQQYLYAETQRPPLSFWDKLTQSFFPPKEDPELQAAFAGLAESAFRVAGLVLLGAVAWVFLLERVTGIPVAGRPWGHAALALTGVLAYAMSYSETARQHARTVAVALGLLLALICIVSVLYFLPVHPEEDHHLPGTLSLVMLAIVAIFPLRPTHTLVLAGATTMLHFALATVGPTLLGITAKPNVAGHTMNTALGALVALGVSSLMYAQRRRAFRANQAMQRALSSLQDAQSRLLVSRVAASQGRLAAALAHELNTPLGVVNSTLSSLERYFERSSDDARREDVSVTMRGLVTGANEASERLSQVVERMKRYTHLDRAETAQCDLNTLITDTIGILGSELKERGTEPILELGTLPPLQCQAQALSAVLTTLIRNASEAVDGKGHVWIKSRLDEKDAAIHVEIRDDGRGIPGDRLADLFEPTFTVKDGRVVTSNWGLSSSRRIIAEHHGYLELESTEGQGTLARIRLPLGGN